MEPMTRAEVEELVLEAQTDKEVPLVTLAQRLRATLLEAFARIEHLSTFTMMDEGPGPKAIREIICEREKARRERDAGYTDRAHAVAALARCALANGMRVGQQMDSSPSMAGYSRLVYVDLPTGQCTWHIADADADLFAFLPLYVLGWDGHTREERNDRLARFALGTG